MSTAPIWLGVLGAVTLSGAFAAVLTFSVSVLTSAGQEAVGGLLSVLAVGLVTAMIFWMRRTAATLSAHLRGEVERAAAIGAGALTLTAFLSVGREGLETTLFLWTAAKASGQTAGPLVGAAIGIAAAIILCWLLYRRAVHLNVGVFFNRTAIALIVIAAGVLAYGLGDLQDAGWLPGHTWVAFDLTAHIDPGSWWASIITGITELSPKMTVLQVTAWLAYLVVVIPAFISAGRTVKAKPGQASAASPGQRRHRRAPPRRARHASRRGGRTRAPGRECRRAWRPPPAWPVGTYRGRPPLARGRGADRRARARGRRDDRGAARRGDRRREHRDREPHRLRARVVHRHERHPDDHGDEQLRPGRRDQPGQRGRRRRRRDRDPRPWHVRAADRDPRGRAPTRSAA